MNVDVKKYSRTKDSVGKWQLRSRKFTLTKNKKFKGRTRTMTYRSIQYGNFWRVKRRRRMTRRRRLLKFNIIRGRGMKHISPTGA